MPDVPATKESQERTQTMLLDLLRYFAFVLTDGDYLNDWLTHLPQVVQPWVLELGKEVAVLIGS